MLPISRIAIYEILRAHYMITEKNMNQKPIAWITEAIRVGPVESQVIPHQNIN